MKKIDFCIILKNECFLSMPLYRDLKGIGVYAAANRRLSYENHIIKELAWRQ